MKKKFGQNLSQIGALYDFHCQKNLGRQSSGIEIRQAIVARHGPFFENLAGQRPLTVLATFLAERKRNGEG